MSDLPPVPVTISILDKEFRIACPPGEKDALLASAQYLDRKMREVRNTGKVVGIDRISVMTALNIAHELLNCQRQLEDLNRELGPRLRTLLKAAEEELDKGRQIEF